MGGLDAIVAVLVGAYLGTHLFAALDRRIRKGTRLHPQALCAGVVRPSSGGSGLTHESHSRASKSCRTTRLTTRRK